MTVASADRYPLDFDKLEKGDTISHAQLEEILGMKKDKDPEKFALEKLKLYGRIQRELWEEGKVYTVRMTGGMIHICDDKEASAYGEKTNKSAVKKLAMTTKRLSGVDLTEFSDAEKRDHEKRVLLNGAMLGACLTIRRYPKLAAHIRKTPELLFDNGENGE